MKKAYHMKLFKCMYLLMNELQKVSPYTCTTELSTAANSAS